MTSGISVIVVTYNRPKDVNEAISSLSRQSVKPFETIVIDDASSPPLVIDSHDIDLRLIRFDREIGLSNARNVGIKLSKGSYLAFMDDDAIAENSWVENIQKGLEKADIVGGLIQPFFEAVPPDWWSVGDFGYTVGVGNGDLGLNEREGIWGCNMAMKKVVFGKTGLFNSDIGRQKGKLLGNDESDLIERAKRKGFKTQFVSDAMVYHRVKSKRMTVRYLAKWSFYSGRTEKLLDGFRPFATGLELARCILLLSSPNIITTNKRDRIKKIVWLTFLLGKLL